jgi:hypothetical protein
VVLFLLSIEHLGQAGIRPVTLDYYPCWIGLSHDRDTATNESSVMDEKD